MHTKKGLYFILLLIFFQLKTVYSHSQSTDFESLTTHPWVDSVLGTLSIAERINQMLVLDVGNGSDSQYDYTSTYGGVLLSSSGPVSHVNTVNSIQQQLYPAALIFSYLDESNGVQMDSVISFGSDLILNAITEPYLLYETGHHLAEHCKHLGIHGLYSITEDIIQIEPSFRDSWRMKEMNQGFNDEGILPMNFLELYTFKDFVIDTLMFQDKLAMLKIHPDNVSDYRQLVMEAIDTGALNVEVLNEKCRHILALKLWSGLDELQELKNIDLQKNLNSGENQVLRQELAQGSLTVLKNDGLLPVGELGNKKIASLTIGKSINSVFDRFLNNYTQVDHYQVSYEAKDEEFIDLWASLNAYDLIITGFYESELLEVESKEFEGFKIFQEWLSESGRCIAVYFGDPILFDKNHILIKASSMVLALENNDLFNALVPQLIFGALEVESLKTLTESEVYKMEVGVAVNSLDRFNYTLPESVGLDGEHLLKIDSIVNRSIEEKVFPGCQVLVAREGSVVYNKSFGFHTYDSLRLVDNSNLYDLASLTKVSGALPGLMKLYEEGKFDLDTTLSAYLPYFKRGNKKNLTFREILAHQAGLKSWIPYWKTTIRKNGKYRRKTLSNSKSVNYPYELTEGLYLHKDYKNKIYKQIKKSKLGEKRYLYSGLTFYLFPDIIEAITGENYANYIYDNFYKPLGATTLSYNPLEKFDLDHIVPTEYDSLFRKTQIHGKVHDEGAAMMKGISSNAGLFSNANDLAKLFQMYCNYGSYGGRKYLKEETVKEFSRIQYPENENRRGLGFDRPLPVPHSNGNTAKSVSQISFGHSGFTGTFAWVDPEYKLVYIFLSNRVYPTRANNKLSEQNVRTNVQEVIYKAMK